MGVGIPPLKIKILLESNPPKSRISVRRMAVARPPCSPAPSEKGLGLSDVIITIITIIIAIIMMIIILQMMTMIIMLIMIMIVLIIITKAFTCMSNSIML